MQQADSLNSPEWLDHFFEIINILEQEKQESLKQIRKAENVRKAKLSKSSRYID